MADWGEDSTKYVIYKGWITNRWFIQYPPDGYVPEGPGYANFEEVRQSFLRGLGV